MTTATMSNSRSKFPRIITVSVTEEQFNELVAEVEKRQLHRSNLLRSWIANGMKQLKRTTC